MRSTGSTALHAGKDLFVAPLPLDRILPEGSLELSLLGVTVVTSILADDGRYPLPISVTLMQYDGACSDFPPVTLLQCGERSPNPVCALLYHILECAVAS